ncbi:MAG: ferrochelatase, partial [Thermoplasmata archaeon]
MNTAVLIMTYGSPERLEDVNEYLRGIFGNRPVPEKVLKENIAKYERFGGRSPSNDIIKKISRKLEKSLASYGDFDVYVSNKHWYPSIDEKISEIKGSFDRLIAIPLFSF